MNAAPPSPGRHRAGATGTVHCTTFAAVVEALAAHRRTWFAALLTPGRHSLAGLRRRSVARQRWWVPVPSPA